MQRFASRIDANGLLNIAIDEINDAALDKLFEEKPEMKDVAGAPIYWSKKYGYWPIPTGGWTTHEIKN